MTRVGLDGRRVTARKPPAKPKTVQRVNVDFPIAFLRALDAEADRLGVTRQAFIKLRLAETLTPSKS